MPGVGDVRGVEKNVNNLEFPLKTMGERAVLVRLAATTNSPQQSVAENNKRSFFLSHHCLILVS